MVYFGIIKGALIMWFLSFIVCYSLILFYNWSKKDWLGIETAKIGIEHGHTSAFLSILQWARKKGKWMLLIFLSIFFDPFITLVSIRDSSHGYKRMNKNDWTIFMSSFIISNLWWSMAVFTGLSVFELIEKYVTTLF